MPAATGIVLSKAAVVGGYAVGAVLAVLVGAIITLASAASSIPPAIENHERSDAARGQAIVRADSAMLVELRRQTCILVSETSAEKRDCLRR